MSFKCCLSSLAAASLAGCTSRVRALPSILLRMVVMLASHLKIFLEICTADAFLHSLLMSAIVVSDKFADAILVFVLRSDLLRLLTCVVVQRLSVRLCVFTLRLLGHLLLTSGTFNLCLTNLCPDAPCYVRRFLSYDEH